MCSHSQAWHSQKLILGDPIHSWDITHPACFKRCPSPHCPLSPPLLLMSPYSFLILFLVGISHLSQSSFLSLSLAKNAPIAWPWRLLLSCHVLVEAKSVLSGYRNLLDYCASRFLCLHACLHLRASVVSLSVCQCVYVCIAGWALSHQCVCIDFLQLS